MCRTPHGGTPLKSPSHSLLSVVLSFWESCTGELSRGPLQMDRSTRAVCLRRELLWLTREWKPVLESKHGLSRARHWRKGDHWRALIRKHAQLAVNDQQLVEAFTRHCKSCHVSITVPHIQA